jgi:hypothetical protein
MKTKLSFRNINRLTFLDFCGIPPFYKSVPQEALAETAAKKHADSCLVFEFGKMAAIFDEESVG